MKIERCGDKAGALEQHYGQLATSEDYVSRSTGEAMLCLLHEMREGPAPYRAWGLTSIDRLCLLAIARFDAPWYVRVIGHGTEYPHRLPCTTIGGSLAGCPNLWRRDFRASGSCDDSHSNGSFGRLGLAGYGVTLGFTNSLWSQPLAEKSLPINLSYNLR